MARKKFSDFRRLRWIKLGLNDERAADVLGVTVEQIKIWDYEDPPVMATRLLLAWDRRVVGLPGWEGWYFSRGTLHYKGEQFLPEGIINARLRDEVFSRLDNDVKSIFAGLGVSRYQSVSVDTSAKAQSFKLPPKKTWWK